MRTPRSLTVVALVIAFGIALADDESDRKNLISQIESKLDAAASKLSGMERKSDAGDIDDAQGYVREVERLVDDLKRFKGSDTTTDRILSNYPGYARDFRSAADDLKKLKLRQPKAVEYLRQCETFDRELRAKANAAKDDPQDAGALAAFAKSVGQKGDELVRDASREWSEVERHRDDVKRFSVNEGRWSGVRGSMHASADEIKNLWRDNYDKVKRACEEVVKGERHREVERVLERLENSRAGRADLYRRIDEQLVKLAEKIKDAEGQTGTGNVKDAIETTKELESQLDRLERAAGDDRETQRVAKMWPAWVRSLRDSLEALAELKYNQNRADDGASKCEAAEKKLDETIKSVLAKRDDLADPGKDLALEAELLGTPIRNGIAAARDVDSKLARWADKAKAFGQTDGRWSRITSNLRDTTDRVHAHWRDKFSAMVKTCDKLVLGKDHPDVKAATDKLRGSTGSEADRTEADVKAWVERARATYILDCKAMEEMWNAYCGVDWEPGDDPDEVPRQTASYLQDKMQKEMAPVLKDLPPLKERVKALVRKTQTRSRGETLTAMIDKESRRLQRLWKSDRWHGNNDPIRQFASNYGKQRHASLWSQFSCKVPTAADKEALFPGSESHRKPDCIIPEKCEVWEFKPDSPSGHKQGPEQADDYRRVVPRYYEERYRAKRAPEDKFGGETAMKTLVEKCLHSGAFELRVDVHYYKVCDAQYECTRGD